MKKADEFRVNARARREENAHRIVLNEKQSSLRPGSPAS
jgi:hypothetical protein